ncbi:DUF4340 domain-containing protein [Thiocystis violacea]|uniref:DUF4340 domain-containing protein n=1 Tax=Thiocystis violacea TaxID=13725 RepID=UPI0019071B83|nr:DUF4340 domain-containing protein [Thiocystis violacea]MBK1716173.1 hypothetical protein [Thiocystis violacea]
MTSTHATSTGTPSSGARTDLRWSSDLRSPLVLGLVLLLGLQLFIALGQSLSGSGMTALDPRTPLFDFTTDQVTRILIEGSDGGEQAHLERRDDGRWVIGDLAGFPAAGTKVDQLLKGVAELKRPLPIATSEAARKRFKVADEGFARRLTLEGRDGRLGTLILGDTPGFRRLFGRPADDPAVYDLALALSDVSNRRDDWIDNGLLRLDQEKIAGIRGADWALTRTAEGWRFADSDEAIDQDAANRAAMSLANLGYRGVLGTEEDPAYNQQTPKLGIEIQLADGGARSYRVSQVGESEDYVLKDADRPYYFKLSKYDLDGLIDLDKSKLTAPAETATTENESGSETEPRPATEPAPETP